MKRTVLLLFFALMGFGMISLAAAQTPATFPGEGRPSLYEPSMPGRTGGNALYLSSNPYLGREVSPYDPRVSRYAPDGARNPYTIGGGRIYAEDGAYLGRLNANRYDPESVANPYGRYGSKYSPESINNPYGRYGSPYSNQSPANPYTATPPLVRYGR